MFKEKFIVGGELTFSPSIFVRKDYHQFSDYGSELYEYQRYYTFGAYYSLKVVIQNLNFQPNEYVLLPSYLCPTMIEPFRKAGIKYDFFKLKEGLLPDLDDIVKKTKHGLKAVLFIDYFGFPQKNYLAPIIEFLKAKGVKIIQDTVQSWLNNEGDLYADFCVNSVRKYLPFEASILFAKNNLKIDFNNKPIHKFLLHKRYAQMLRFYHLEYGLFRSKSFLNHINIANQNYHHDCIIGMPKLNQWLLDRIDIISLGQKRHKVFLELISKLNPKQILKKNSNYVIPLGLAVYLEDRNKKKKLLHSHDIHCPLHWKLSEEINKKEHEYSWDLEKHALTLPVNVKLHKLAKYIEKLRKVL
jgi:hypothetical protein